jgi:hypothetical protein
MEIKPTYVTFEQAKILADKKFLVHTRYGYTKDGVLERPHYGESYINLDFENSVTYSAPEQWQVVEWLDKKYNQYIHIQKHTRNGLKCYSPFINNKTVKKDVFFNDFDTPQEAYSAAFDYILNNLL